MSHIEEKEIKVHPRIEQRARRVLHGASSARIQETIDAHERLKQQPTDFDNAVADIYRKLRAEALARENTLPKKKRSYK